jgi:hypothetical protein
VDDTGDPVPIRWPLPLTQAAALDRSRRGAWASHLQKDWVSPDLDRVLLNISRQRVDKNRRARARALYETLERAWDRLAPCSATEAVHHYFTWKLDARIPATWLARASQEPWLTNKGGTQGSPRELAIETPLTRLTRGADRTQSVFELDEGDWAAPLAAALGIQGTAPASELLVELVASIRDEFGPDVRPEDVRPTIAPSNLRLPGDGGHQRRHAVNLCPDSALVQARRRLDVPSPTDVMSGRDGRDGSSLVARPLAGMRIAERSSASHAPC